MPPIEFKLNRKQLADDAKFKLACVQPKLHKSSKLLKNLEGNKIFGEVYGRVHIRQQNLKSLKLKFSKKIRKTKPYVMKPKKTKPQNEKPQEMKPQTTKTPPTSILN